MDTSGLGTSLSLAASLLVFAYLNLAESGLSAANAPPRSSADLRRLLLAIRFLRLAGIIAVVLLAEALLSSQGASRVAIVAPALLGFLVALDRAAAILSSRIPGLSSKLSAPVQVPLLGLLHACSALGIRREGHDGDRNGPRSVSAESAVLVITEEEQATLDFHERFMIRSILDLDDSTAKEIMVPRVDIVAIEDHTQITDVASRMLESGHSRLPVFYETIDHITGVVYSRDLLPFLKNTDQYPPLEQIIRPAFFIPETKRLDELLKELQEKRVHMAIVVDEYGGVEGLVTLEDLLEEIVGEIEDEFSRTHEPRVVPMANGDTIVDAGVTLDDLSDLLPTSTDVDGFDTVGGLVYSNLGKMPQVGDTLVYDGFRIEVLSMLGRRIRKLKLSTSHSPDPP